MANSLFLDGTIGETLKWRLHPLIHTIAPETSAQDVEKKKAEPKTPHFLSLNQDIVAWSQEEKCRLKYEIFSQSKRSTELFSAFGCEWLYGSSHRLYRVWSGKG